MADAARPPVTSVTTSQRVAMASTVCDIVTVVTGGLREAVEAPFDLLHFAGLVHPDEELPHVGVRQASRVRDFPW